MLNVVILNGGRGAASIIPAMLRRQGLQVTSIVNAYDDGKSTGEIRRYFGMLGPSDIRKVQELMLPEGVAGLETAGELFTFRYPLNAQADAVLADMEAFSRGGERLAGISVAHPALRATLERFVRAFTEGLQVIEAVRGTRFDFADCSLMNCLYAGAFLDHGRDMEATTRAFDRLFRLRGAVLPNSLENKWLAAVRENGEVLYSEAEIVELRSNVCIEAIYLLDQPLQRERFGTLTLDQQRFYLARHHSEPIASAGVRLAIAAADVIIYSAGTQHSSLYPTYLSRGVAETIAGNRRALKAFVTNIGADYETPTYRASDYLRGAYKFLCLADRRHYDPAELFDFVLVNSSRRKADESYVEYDENGYDGLPMARVIDDFESETAPGKHDGDRVISRILELFEDGVGRGR